MNLNFEDFSRGLSEGLKASAYRPNINGYVPHSKQVAFHTSNKRGRLFIGGNRSGKTVAGATEAIWWASKRHPYRELPPGEIRGRAVGVDFANGIEKILKPEIKRWIAPSMLIKGSWEESFNNNTKTLSFSNGSFIEFMSYDQDLDKFAGTSRHFVWYDEEPPKSVFNECSMRLVDTRGSWWMTMTPVEGVSWVYYDIYEPWKLGDNPNVSILEVNTEQNPHVSEDEMDLMLATSSEEERAARKQGKFVFMTGLVFDTFSPNVHVCTPVTKEIIRNRNNRLAVSIDPGLRVGSFLWHLISRTGKVLTFREFTCKNLTIPQFADEYHRYNREIGRVPDLIVIDPAAKQRQQLSGNTVQAEYASRGVYAALGNNQVDLGIGKMRAYLETDQNNKAMWQVTEDCPILIKNLQNYRWDEWASKKQSEKNDIKMKPKKKDDHDIDSCRYLFAMMPDLKEIKTLAPKQNPALELINPAQTYDPDNFFSRRPYNMLEEVYGDISSEIGEF